MTLLQGDCLELMKDIPAGSVDMVLCDLPYGTTRNQWDNVIPFEPLWKQYHRVCKPNAAIVLFSQMLFSAQAVMSNPHEFRYEIIWMKSQGTGHLNANRMPLKIHENILVFYGALPTYNPQKATGYAPYKKSGLHGSTNYGKQRNCESVNTDGTRFPVDVVSFKGCNSSKDKPIHPTQKPVSLLEYLIYTYSNERETILDNCMGSGSTGVACVNTDRDFIGIERDPGYFESAKRRIKETEIPLWTTHKRYGTSCFPPG